MSDSIVEHGLTFRRIPAGPFLMGSNDGDPDERPVHEVELPEFWLTEVPVSWADYTRIMGWGAPPMGMPERGDLSDEAWFTLIWPLELQRMIRLQYCEDATTRAVDAFSYAARHRPAGSPTASTQFGRLPSTPSPPISYSQKPVVAVTWHDAVEACERLVTPGVTYRLPTEAEWEKAARGGLIGKRYAWGDEPPSHERCDFARFDEFSILPSRTFAPNGYGLYAMCGGVWEWTGDTYDALAYTGAPRPADPTPAIEGPPAAPLTELEQRALPERVLRGGSWADEAEACTVSFRMGRGSVTRRERPYLCPPSATIGFRVARVAKTPT